MTCLIRIRFKWLVGILAAVLVLTTIFAALPEKSSMAAGASDQQTEKTVELPILMYHHMLKSSKLLGTYTITPTEFENDLKYIQKNGFTTITMSDLIAYSEGKGELPDKPIMITFDDGYESTYLYAYPLLKQYNMKAVVSIIGYYTDLYSNTQDKNVNYSHITWSQLQEMIDSGFIEIQNHSYNMHSGSTRKGVKKKDGETMEEYRSALTADITQLQNEIQRNLSVTASTFTYPFGYITKESKSIVKDLGFKASLSCEEGVNVLSGNPEELYLLMRYNRPHNVSTEKFMQKVRSGKRKGPILSQ